jgi:GT2 family glycosyltransferase
VNEAKRVAVVIPAYNAERTLDRCLEAVGRSAVRPSALIVVDDGSTDATADIAGRWPCSLVRLPRNGGQSRARNIGAAEAPACDYYCFLDADVVVRPDTLSRLIGCLEEDDRRGAVSAVYDCEVDGLGFFGRYKNLYLSYKWRRLKGPTTIMNCSAAVIRAELFQELGGFNERMRAAEDADLGTRAAQTRQVRVVESAEVIHLKPHSLGSVLRDTAVKGYHNVTFLCGRDPAATRRDAARRRLLSFPWHELASILAAGAAGIAAATGAHLALWAVLFGAYCLARAPLAAYLMRRGGFLFAVGAILYMPIESIVCWAPLVWGLTSTAARRLQPGYARGSLAAAAET